ncbi:MAG: hypothetical protein M0R70_01190 [Nitrospirae bacterium]|nr:hypothetical protein [Nitrospirota bacterium]
MYQKSRINVIPVILFCVVLSVSISGCSNKDADFDPRSALASTPTTTLTLTWDAPTTYTDGSTLASGDLKEFRIYFSNQPGSYSTGSYYIVLAPATSVTVTEIISQPAGTYYFVVTAVDTTNMESDISNEVSRNFQ